MPYDSPTAQDKFTNMILCKDRVNQHDHIKQTKQVQFTFFKYRQIYHNIYNVEYMTVSSLRLPAVREHFVAVTIVAATDIYLTAQ